MCNRYTTFMSCPSFSWKNAPLCLETTILLNLVVHHSSHIHRSSHSLSIECSRHSAGTKSNTYLVHVWLWMQNLFPVILLKTGTNYYWLQNRVHVSFSWTYAKGCTHPLRSWQNFLIHDGTSVELSSKFLWQL